MSPGRSGTGHRADGRRHGADGNGRAGPRGSPAPHHAIDLPDATARRDRIEKKLGKIVHLTHEHRGQDLDGLRDVWVECVPEHRRRWPSNLHHQTADHDVLLSAERELDDWLERLASYA